MSYIHCIITRFSFRFRKTDLVDQLLAPERLDHRFKIFETFCLPSILNQDNPQFYWIIVIDPLLPQRYISRLEEIASKHEKSETYAKKGPRQFIFHKWNWDIDKLENIDWLLKYFEKKPKFLITTRLDDDDALSKNFIKTIQSNLTSKEPTDKINSFRYLSYSNGYHYYTAGNKLKIARNPMIALGLSLITRVDKYPMSVYLGNHTQIPKYLKQPEKHKKMLQLYRKNSDLPVTFQQVKTRLRIIRDTEPMWVRTIHGFNIQPTLQKHALKHRNAEVNQKIKTILNDRFCLLATLDL